MSYFPARDRSLLEAMAAGGAGVFLPFRRRRAGHPDPAPHRRRHRPGPGHRPGRPAHARPGHHRGRRCAQRAELLPGLPLRGDLAAGRLRPAERHLHPSAASELCLPRPLPRPASSCRAPPPTSRACAASSVSLCCAASISSSCSSPSPSSCCCSIGGWR